MSNTVKMDWKPLESAILRWGEEKGILTNSDPKTQCLKCVSEIGELADNIAKGDHDAAQDDLGDVLVTLILLAKLTDLDLMECLTIAYETIRRREGKMVNGVFVKHAV
jgi:NTP pyrophosphatase (non-canonical NTP hydrolase)